MELIKKIKSVKLFSKLKKAKAGRSMGQAMSDILAFVVVGLTAAGGSLGLAAFNDSSTVTTNSFANIITNNSLSGILNTTSLFGVIGILIGVGILLAVVLTFAGRCN